MVDVRSFSNYKISHQQSSQRPNFSSEVDGGPSLSEKRAEVQGKKELPRS